MEEEKTGTKETKEVLELFFSLAKAVSTSLSDGTVGVFDLAHFFKVIGYIAPAFNDSELIIKELKDLDEKEKAELILFVQEKFDIENDTIEKYIEMALIAMVNFIPVIKVFSDKKK